MQQDSAAITAGVKPPERNQVIDPIFPQRSHSAASATFSHGEDSGALEDTSAAARCAISVTCSSVSLMVSSIID
jgi:hypothetical protein